MHSENILDDQQVIQPFSGRKHRPLAIALEAIPLLVILIGLFTHQIQMIVWGWVALTIIYVLGSWYIFKADKYRIKDIIFAEVAAIFGIIPLLTAFIYQVLSWPGANEMFLAANTILYFLFVVICLWYFIHRKRSMEWRLSLKLLLRIVLLIGFSLILSFLNIM